MAADLHLTALLLLHHKPAGAALQDSRTAHKTRK